MSNENEEKIIASNEFGTVTEKRVTYFRKKGWLSGGTREDVPLKHITSVRFEISRNPVWGLFWLFIGMATLKSIGILFVGLAILLFWGSPAVIVSTTAGDKTPSKSWPWRTKPAKEFADALKSQIFKE